MSEQYQENEQVTLHLQALQRYMRAMESGDIEGLAAVLSEAEQNPVLERMILELNEMYQYEDGVVVQPVELARFQHLLQDTAAVYKTVDPREAPRKGGRYISGKGQHVDPSLAALTGRFFEGAGSIPFDDHQCLVGTRLIASASWDVKPLPTRVHAQRRTRSIASLPGIVLAGVARRGSTTALVNPAQRGISNKPTPESSLAGGFAGVDNRALADSRCKNLTDTPVDLVKQLAKTGANGQVVPGTLPTRKVATQVLSTRKTTTQVLEPRRVETRNWYQLRRSWLMAALAASLVVLLLFPGTGVLAEQFLALFRVQQFQVVHVTKQDITSLRSHTMPSLRDFGTINIEPGSLKVQSKLTQTQATQLVNFPLLLPTTLPHGIIDKPVFAVLGSGHGTFTFDATKAHQFFTKNGNGNVQIPANLDGATYDFTTSAGVEIAYSGTGSEGTQFMIVELPSPVVTATGKASLENLRDFFLSLPGLPPAIVTQLKQIDLSSGTVPLPVPADLDASSVSVQGTSGVLLTSNVATSIENIKKFPAGSAVLWQMHGIVYVVGGVVSNTDQLLATADSLK